MTFQLRGFLTAGLRTRVETKLSTVLVIAVRPWLSRLLYYGSPILSPGVRYVASQ